MDELILPKLAGCYTVRLSNHGIVVAWYDPVSEEWSTCDRRVIGYGTKIKLAVEYGQVDVMGYTVNQNCIN